MSDVPPSPDCQPTAPLPGHATRRGTDQRALASPGQTQTTELNLVDENQLALFGPNRGRRLPPANDDQRPVFDDPPRAEATAPPDPNQGRLFPAERTQPTPPAYPSRPVAGQARPNGVGTATFQPPTEWPRPLGPPANQSSGPANRSDQPAPLVTLEQNWRAATAEPMAKPAFRIGSILPSGEHHLDFLYRRQALIAGALLGVLAIVAVATFPRSWDDPGPGVSTDAGTATTDGAASLSGPASGLAGTSATLAPRSQPDPGQIQAPQPTTTEPSTSEPGPEDQPANSPSTSIPAPATTVVATSETSAIVGPLPCLPPLLTIGCPTTTLGPAGPSLTSVPPSTEPLPSTDPTGPSTLPPTTGPPTTEPPPTTKPPTTKPSTTKPPTTRPPTTKPQTTKPPTTKPSTTKPPTTEPPPTSDPPTTEPPPTSDPTTTEPPTSTDPPTTPTSEPPTGEPATSVGIEGPGIS